MSGYAQKLLPISEQLVHRLSALAPGTADKPALNRLVAALRNGNRGLAQLQSATSAAQTTQASKLIVAMSVPDAAHALGASSCAATPSA